MDSVFGPIFDAIGWLLAQFYSVIPNLGIAIILLTIVIMLLLYPLTAKQTRSMMAMQRVQPEIKKLQAKYKQDRQKLNEEMMKFYQENKINPLAGCLPLLVQMPIFISLFSVLRDAYKYVPKSSKLYDAFCHGFGLGDLPACGTELKARMLELPGVPTGLVKGEKLIHHLNFLGLDLQKSATAKHDGFMDAFPYFLLVVLVIVTYVVQSRQSAKRTPAANKQMGALMKIMPPFFGLISIGLPSGLVLYLFVSALFRLGQQEVIFRRHGSALHGPGGKPLEVRSTDRTKTATAVLEAPEDPEPDRATIARAKPAPAPERVVPSGERAGGLRGMFALPPPPETNGGSGRPSSSGSSGGESSAPRSSAPRRRNKKKRKR